MACGFPIAILVENALVLRTEEGVRGTGYIGSGFA